MTRGNRTVSHTWDVADAAAGRALVRQLTSPNTFCESSAQNRVRTPREAPPGVGYDWLMPTNGPETAISAELSLSFSNVVALSTTAADPINESRCFLPWRCVFQLHGVAPDGSFQLVCNSYSEWCEESANGF
ncbi:unnamed protein product [Schistocephalus solidus]|uniref:CUB domain-containing protein n=1 Tax=Schistocephalus solidus TaxID=70667 RepID=A0A183T3S3_SCHSO|nr:unnamed protein product [Schistocephalus solidus]